MVKVITISDESYKKLARVKKKIKGSFSDAINYLIDIAAKEEHTREQINLSGSLKPRDIRRDRLRRLIKW